MAHTLVEHFQEMAANNAWSNQRLHQACAQLTNIAPPHLDEFFLADGKAASLVTMEDQN